MKVDTKVHTELFYFCKVQEHINLINGANSQSGGMDYL